MHPDVIAALRCPHCGAPLALADGDRALRCGGGHAFDVARHGYVSFAVGRPTGLVGDDAEMVHARARFLAGGHFAPLAGAVAAHAAPAGPGLVVEVGAGTAYHLARAVDAVPGRVGLAVDLSTHAARRAARAHPRVGAVVADTRGPLPIADGRAAVALAVFAPRNVAELRRVLRPDGAVVVASATAGHLAELRARVGLLEVEAEKDRRVAAAFEPCFERSASADLAWTMSLGRDDAFALATMGPSARHLDRAALAARVRELPEPLPVTASVRVDAWRPRP